MPRRGISIPYPKQSGDASMSGNAHSRDDAPSAKSRKTVKKSIVAPKDDDSPRPVRRKRKAPVPDLPPTLDNAEGETNPAEPPAKRQARSDVRYNSPALVPALEADQDQPDYTGFT
ncbi:hypothetical protein PV04_00315 [Phialophora macrospora]|uniref:Uncharacterized protein n=1 Tax=Phialophora macrospora TaxID=1851006 RepID=A0A0D2G034_9EURO|nr:hypothetical protein PV04_00315 [Phialophora macrospora]